MPTRSLLPIIILLAACEPRAARADLTAVEAFEIADKAFYKEFPRDRRRIRTPFVSDQGKYWLVEFDLPSGYAGGIPTFIIDKESGEVITAYSDQ